MIFFFLNIRQPIRLFFVILYVGCIAALSLLPVQDFPKLPVFDGFDKVVHFGMYFIFSALFCWALKTELNYLWLILIFPATIGWGVLMEFLQSSMHMGRSFSYFDMLANCFGVIAGILLYLLVARKYASS